MMLLSLHFHRVTPAQAGVHLEGVPIAQFGVDHPRMDSGLRRNDIAFVEVSTP
ncbi:MAG: hypothetical protein J0I99_07615 [Devosia sp.]|uniref:hypothetical protein n=1 Tax=Devosia sp. TaxID=1871048 RepID=UPI001ACFDF5A|nr:hypothetical protein [Devosia sp.]MBN9315587.1 hypothetical protein [Devosia sp.]